MKKFISILGSTGSIGTNTLDIIEKKKNFFKPLVFSANKNYNLICKQIIKFKPKYFVINDEKIFERVKKKFLKNKVKILKDYKKLNLKIKKNITISAIPGIDGLEPILKMINYSDKILLANKEAVICGWDLINKKALLNKTKIVHSIIPLGSSPTAWKHVLQKNNIHDMIVFPQLDYARDYHHFDIKTSEFATDLMIEKINAVDKISK